MATKKATTVTLTTTVNLDTGTVYASPSALRKAGLSPNAKDKGIKASYTNKEGELVEYKVYSVLDATKATVKKPAKKASKTDYDAMKTLLDNPEAIAVLKALLADK